MTFAWPWAFLGLLALPALAAIYRLRQRAPRRQVSSLMLWRAELESRAGGRRLERFEASRLFWLELLILLLLVVAAAGPRLPSSSSRRPLIAVLDDSFSMRAGGEGSPRAAAAAALERELETGRHAAVTLIAAGEKPQVLGDGSGAADDLAGWLAGWRAAAPAAALEEAVALAFDLGGSRSRVLVLTDHPPPSPPAAGRLAWWAFGQPRPNRALVNAVRGPDGRSEATDGCLVEVANFSPRPADLQLRVAVENGPPSEAGSLQLAAGEVGRFRFEAPRGRTVRLELEGDALELDDRAVLLPERARSVRVALEIGDAGLRRAIEDALAASERAVLSSAGAQLVITDGAEAVGGLDGAWRLRVVAEDPAVPYLGPFVLDRSHPLTEGLALGGVVWGAGKGAQEPAGAPVVTAGDVTLLADRETAGGGHHLTLRWRDDLSTLQRTPSWPILWWNLLAWRAGSVPGVRAANLRLGASASVGILPGVEAADLELPDGSRRRLAVRGGRLEVRAGQVGIHRLHHGGRTERWAVNALAAAESDLRGAASGRWGGWDAAARHSERRDVAWAALLAAAALLVLHLAWTGRGRRR